MARGDGLFCRLTIFIFFEKALYLSSHLEVNMKITAMQLRQIIKEELRRALVEAPVRRDTVSQQILDVMAANGPMTKAEIIQTMGKKAGYGAKAGYNISAYFANVSPDAKASFGNNLSLVSSGHVEVVGREDSRLVYGLTELGEEEAGM